MMEGMEWIEFKKKKKKNDGWVAMATENSASALTISLLRPRKK